MLMRIDGWVFMFAAWAAILALFGLAMVRTLRRKKNG
jgi:hypothetical protein